MYACLIPGHWEAGMKGTIVVPPGIAGCIEVDDVIRTTCC